VVHITGGAAALIGAIIVGPRIGRFKQGRVFPLPGHSVVLVTLGYFMLWFGFFAFNAASEGGIAGDGYDPDNVGRAVVNTALSAAGGTFSALIILKLGFIRMNYKIMGKTVKGWTPFGGYWSMCGAINGGITGMVSICAGCFAVEPWAGYVIGTVAGWFDFFYA
jgi:ammonium transporter, Amt family